MFVWGTPAPDATNLPMFLPHWCCHLLLLLLLQAAPARLHAYVGNACPWCHRVLLAVALLGLSGRVGVTHLQVRVGAGLPFEVRVRGQAGRGWR
jgi:hypothetical protein